MWEELSFFSRYMQKLGHRHCQAMFGFAWGNEYYGNERWDDVLVPLSALTDEVRRVEEAGFGTLGSDDLYLKIASQEVELQFRFCNDSDIHIEYDQRSQTTEFFYQRWLSRGYSPVEWKKGRKGRPSERIRPQAGAARDR